MEPCGHGLCAVIGGACSLRVQRSRGCRPNVTAREVAPEVFAEVRTLLAAFDREAAIRLAQIVRREAMDDRNLVTLAHEEDLELAPRLAELCARRAS